MSIFGIRIFLYTILPLLAAGIQIGMDKSTRSRERKLEVFLLYLFGLGVAGSGLGGFFAHFFLSDLVAESIGWPAGNPFQLEIAFANLAIGILGIGCVGRRDGFRALAVGVLTAVVATGFGVGFAIEQPLLGTALGIIAGASWQPSSSPVPQVSRAPPRPMARLRGPEGGFLTRRELNQ